MYLIDRKNNGVQPLEKRTFTELKFRERANLQEWIDKNPDILGMPLLVIQKEFHGFEGTNERLDLLALDKQGNLVIIENKLDDSGRDVVWQALKYASYCAGMSKEDIVSAYQMYLDASMRKEEAEQNIRDFLESDSFDELNLNGGDQRIILVAASFRTEVTSTVMWLLDHQIRITCIVVSLFQLGEQLFLDTDQILPPPDTEEYRIRMAKKRQANVMADEDQLANKTLRFAFWEYALPKLREGTGIYQNVSATKDSWISGASGHSGIGYNCIASKNFLRAEIYIDIGNADQNKKVFEYLYSHKENLDKALGNTVDWDRLDAKRASRISITNNSFDMANRDVWSKMAGFLTESIRQMKSTLQAPIDEILSLIKTKKA